MLAEGVQHTISGRAPSSRRTLQSVFSDENMLPTCEKVVRFSDVADASSSISFSKSDE